MMQNSERLLLGGKLLWSVCKGLFSVVGFAFRHYIISTFIILGACYYFEVGGVDLNTLVLAFLFFAFVGSVYEATQRPDLTNSSYIQNRYDDF